MSAALRLWLPLTYRTSELHRLLAVVEEPNLLRPPAGAGGLSLRGHSARVRAQGDGFISLRHYAILRSDLPSSL